MLGSAVFWHVYDPAQVVIDYSRIIGYTMIHVSAFVVVGCIAAALAAEVEVAPPTLFLVLVAFCFFEFGFYVLVAILAQPLLGALAWWNVAIGNALAAFGMGWYLWREHPRIGEELKRHPLACRRTGVAARGASTYASRGTAVRPPPFLRATPNGTTPPSPRPRAPACLPPT